MSDTGNTFLSAYRPKEPDMPSDARQNGLPRKHDHIARHYKKTAAGFNKLYSTINEPAGGNTLTPAADAYFTNIKDEFDAIDDKVRSFLEILSNITDDIEYMAAVKSVEHSVQAAEILYNTLQADLRGMAEARNELNRRNNPGFTLFAGCDTIEKLKKRYKELSKNYHPDTDSGDKDAMQIINTEYNRLLRIFDDNNNTQ